MLMAGTGSDALGQTNQAHRQQLLQSVPPNYSIARSPKAARQGYVPTNTLAFQDWVLTLMVTRANFLNDQWQLGLPKPITSDHVTYFSAVAKINGPEGAILVNDRFVVGFLNGRWHSFEDKRFGWSSLESDIPRLEQLTRQPSLLSKAAAEAVAKEALRAIGVDETKLKVSLHSEVTQYDYESKDGKVSPLPLFEVQWKAGEEPGPIRMQISGLTKKVVAYANYMTPAMSLPANYFAMLGVSSRAEEWGSQFGYDKADTREFQASARQLATEQVNRLNDAWSLGSRNLSTNDLEIFLAKPLTNTFDITMAQFGHRFYLQVQHGRIQLFKDLSNNLEGLIASDAKLADLAKYTNTLAEATAERIARDAMRRLGLSEKELQLQEPPSTKQVRLPTESGRPLSLPLFDVMWKFPPKEQQKYGEGTAAVAFQISALTTGVVMYANNSPLAPQLTIRTNAPLSP